MLMTAYARGVNAMTQLFSATAEGGCVEVPALAETLCADETADMAKEWGPVMTHATFGGGTHTPADHTELTCITDHI